MMLPLVFLACLVALPVAAVQPLPTSITLASSMNPSPFGELVTFTASLHAKSGQPSGTVLFKEGDTLLGSGTLSGSGVTTFSTPLLAAGSHLIHASYSGNASWAVSTSLKLPQVIKRAPTTITLTSKTNSPYIFGQMQTFSASVVTQNPAPTAGPPTGMVTFKDGGTALGSAKLDMFQQASLNTSALSGGKHVIKGLYEGNANFEPSASASSDLIVTKARTAITLASSPNPSTMKQPVTLNAVISNQNASGNVQFLDGPKPLGAARITSGKAVLTLPTLTAGMHAFHAHYTGDNSIEACDSPVLNQTVQ